MDHIFAGEGTGVGSGPLCKMESNWVVGFLLQAPVELSRVFQLPSHYNYPEEAAQSHRVERCRLARGIWSKTGQKGN